VFCSWNFSQWPYVWGSYCSISLGVSGFMWKALIHLDLSFVQGNKKGSICILLHADHQLNQYHLLEILSFFLAHLSKNKWYRCVGSFLGPQFYSTDLPPSVCTNTTHFLSLCNTPGCQMVIFPKSSFTVGDSFHYPILFCCHFFVFCFCFCFMLPASMRILHFVPTISHLNTLAFP